MPDFASWLSLVIEIPSLVIGHLSLLFSLVIVIWSLVILLIPGDWVFPLLFGENLG
jgi:uncharacterized membrane protein